MTNPLVSICLPVYNGEKWVEQAIRTLIDQTYENIEIIIADDCSDDNTPGICANFSLRYRSVTFIQNKTNVGAQRNFRNLLNMISGKYVIYASQDDYWDENYVSLLVEKLESNDTLVLAGGATQLLTEGDRKDRVIEFGDKWNPEHLSTYGLIYSLMLPCNHGEWLKNNMFFHGVLRTAVLKYCFSIFPGVIAEERHFMLLLALSGAWGYVDHILYYRRINVGGFQLKKSSNDPVYRRKKSLAYPVIGFFQMILGVYKIRNVPLIKKLYSILISVLHTLYAYYYLLLSGYRKIIFYLRTT